MERAVGGKESHRLLGGERVEIKDITNKCCLKHC